MSEITRLTHLSCAEGFGCALQACTCGFAQKCYPKSVYVEMEPMRVDVGQCALSTGALTVLSILFFFGTLTLVIITRALIMSRCRLLDKQSAVGASTTEWRAECASHGDDNAVQLDAGESDDSGGGTGLVPVT